MSMRADADAADRSMGEQPRNPLLDARRGRVLLVDDDDGVLRVLRRALDDFDLVTARDGREALTLIGTNADFDLILCDVVMPNMGGVELWSVIADTRPDALDRFVLMTGGALTVEDERFLGTGIVHVIWKPFSFHTLRRVVLARVDARLTR